MSKDLASALFLLAAIAMCPTLAAQNQAGADRSKTYAFVNGNWFEGKEFRPDKFYAVHGVLTRTQPATAFETVDLQGGYAIPALADAHSHLPDQEANFDWGNGQALKAGVFYILNPNDIAEKSNPLRPRLQTPSSIDIVFAHAGFTSPGGHPTALYESLLARKIYSYQKSELEGRAFYSIDSRADIDSKWPIFLKSNPDFVKVYLLYSERYSSKNTQIKSLGLRPEFAQEIVRRAHKAGLRAGAHIETAADFHEALAARVDFIMHLPGYYLANGSSYDDYVISTNDATVAARRGVYVVTTASLLDAKDERLREIQLQNIRLLKTAGVKLLIGSDGPPGSGAQDEADYLRKTGIFSNLKLLDMWCHVTPRAILPHRKIGELKEGYAADFLVLSGNPLENFAATKEMRLRVKQGEVEK
jgi:imidazolonepropionase-like amidohydrolase